MQGANKHAVCAPVDRLPDEILLDVFLRTAEYYGSIGFAPPSASRSPLVLTVISQRWRALSLGYARLWELLHCVISEKTDVDRVLPGWQAWIARSGAVLLLIGLVLSCMRPDVVNPLLELMYSCSSRWKCLLLRVNTELVSSFSRFPESELRHLEYLDISTQYAFTFDWLSPLIVACGPSVRNLEIMVLDDDTILPLNASIWTNLTHLNIGSNVFEEHFADILRLCVNLVHCTACFCERLPAPPSSALFTLPRLDHLHIRVDPEEYRIGFHDIFESISLPALTFLGVFAMVWPIPSFLPFLERSKCALTSLYIGYTNITERELIDILRAVGWSLEKVYISPPTSHRGGHCIGDEVLGLLNQDKTGSDVLAPRLVDLHIVQQSLRWTDGAFADMVESRLFSPNEGGKNATRMHSVVLELEMPMETTHPEEERRLCIQTEWVECSHAGHHMALRLGVTLLRAWLFPIPDIRFPIPDSINASVQGCAKPACANAAHVGSVAVV